MQRADQALAPETAPPQPVALLALSLGVGAVLTVLADCTIGHFRSDPVRDGFDSLSAALIVLGAAGIAGLCALAAGAVLGLLLRPLPRTVAHWIVIGGCTAFVITRNWALLDGAWISAQSWRPLGYVALVAVGAGIGLLVRLLLRRAPGLSLRTALLLAAAGWALLFLNALVLAGHYPRVHEQELALAGALFATCSFVLLRRFAAGPHAATRALSVAALCACPVLVAFMADQPHPATESVLLNRVPSLAQLARGMHALGWRAQAPRTSDLAAFTRFLERDAAADRRELDRRFPQRRNWNLLIVSVDTARADAVGFMGAQPSPTPFADTLAAEATVFERAITPYPTSNFAYSALFTGLHARISPAMDPLGKRGWEFPAGTTLAECCASAGMSTAGFSAFNAETAANPRWFGHLRRGFGIYNPRQSESNATAANVAGDAADAITALRDKRWFVWAHVLEPHSPYEAEALAGAPAGQERYWGEIATADRALETAFAALRDTGQLEHTVVVWMADHGEEFGERGGAYHNTSLFEEQTHVPLFVRFPGSAPLRISQPVSLADLCPTLLEVLDIPDALPRTGRSVVPLLLQREGARGVAVSELFRNAGDKLDPAARAVWQDNEKFVVRDDTGTEARYDLAEDPQERRNLIGSDRKRDAALRELLTAYDLFIDAHHQSTGPTFDAAAPHRWRGELDAALAMLPKGAGLELENVLFTPYGELRSAALKHLGLGGVHEVLRDLVARIDTLPPLAAGRVALLLAKAGMKDDLLGLWNDQRGPRPMVALGLAMCGDSSGRQLLLDALRSGATPVPHGTAVALVRIGEVEALPWLWLVFNASSWELVAAALDSLEAVSVVSDKVSVFGDRLRAEAFLPAPVALRALKVLAAEKSDDASALVALLSQHLDPEVRAAALPILETRFGAESAHAEMQRSALEVEADVAALNQNYALATRKYAEACDGSRIHRVRARIREAVALAMAGDTKAATLLCEREAAATKEFWLKPVLERLPQTFAPASRPLATLAAKAEPLGELPEIAPTQVFSVPLRLTNTGTAAWPGGHALFAPTLSVRYVRADGSFVEQPARILTPLPETGVLPGETITTFILASRPMDSADAKPVIVFEQRWFTAPDNGILFRW